MRGYLFLVLSVLLLLVAAQDSASASDPEWSWLIEAINELEGRETGRPNGLAPFKPWPSRFGVALTKVSVGKDLGAEKACITLHCGPTEREKLRAVARGDTRALWSLAEFSGFIMGGGHGTVLAASLARRATKLGLESCDKNQTDGFATMLADHLRLTMFSVIESRRSEKLGTGNFNVG